MRLHFIVIAAALTLQLETLGAPPVSFLDARRDYMLPEGTVSTSIAIGDFDGDGRPDLVVANVAPSGSVAVLLAGRGHTFRPPHVYAAGQQPSCVAVGDLNRDGHLDIVTANFRGGDVSVLLGRGDGTFAPATEYPAGPGASWVAIADLNGDGIPDLAVATAGSTNTLALLFGKGDGTFSEPVAIGAGPGVTSVATGDFDADGKLDLVVSNSSGTVSVLRGNGDGTFQTPLSSATGLVRPTSVTVADFDSDGKLDIAVADSGGSSIAVLRGRGDGSFQSPAIISLPEYTPFVTSGDFNGDGRPDLVVALNNNGSHSYPLNGIAVLLNAGQQGFQPARLYSAPELPIAIAVADLNQDGHLDIAVATQGDLLTSPTHAPLVSVIFGNARGTFAGPPQLAAGGKGPVVSAADFDGDGRLDLAVANTYAHNLIIFLNAGGGVFKGLPAISLPPEPFLIAAGDFNGDGKADLAIATTRVGGNHLYALLGNGDGTFQAPIESPTGGLFFDGIVVGDFNRDGRPDLAIIDDFGQKVTILIAAGDGTFTIRQTVPLPSMPNLNYAVAADFNHDRKLDLAISLETNLTQLSILLGNGDGTFQAPITTNAPDSGPLAAGDMNRDGNMDLVLAGFQGVYVLAGNGDGSFRSSEMFRAPRWPGAVVVADFNRDGNLDVATLNLGADVAVLAGDGAGNLRQESIFGAGVGNWNSMVVADLTEDRRPDIVAAGVGLFGSISILFNDSP
jgi:hypothetical protein